MITQKYASILWVITACAFDIAQQVAKREPWTSTGAMSWQVLGESGLCGLQERCRVSGAARAAQGNHGASLQATPRPKSPSWEKVVHVQELVACAFTLRYPAPPQMPRAQVSPPGTSSGPWY